MPIFYKMKRKILQKQLKGATTEAERRKGARAREAEIEKLRYDIKEQRGKHSRGDFVGKVKEYYKTAKASAKTRRTEELSRLRTQVSIQKQKNQLKKLRSSGKAYADDMFGSFDSMFPSSQSQGNFNPVTGEWTGTRRAPKKRRSKTKKRRKKRKR